MGKETVQGIILERLDKIEVKIDQIVPVVEGLKIKASIVGGIAGLVGTAVLTAILSAFK